MKKKKVQLLGLLLLMCVIFWVMVKYDSTHQEEMKVNEAASVTEVSKNEKKDQDIELEELIIDTAIVDMGMYEQDLYEQLFDDQIYHHFKIIISEDEYYGMAEDMMDLSSIDDRMRTGKYRQADLLIWYEEQWVKIDEVGIRTKGNTTRRLPVSDDMFHKFHFKIKFNETFDYGEDSMEYKWLGERKVATMTSLNFKWNMNDDTTYVRELTGYDMLRKAGVTTSKASLAHVDFVIDGESFNYGLYTIIEPINKAFIEKRFEASLTDGDLYKCLWQNYGPATLEPIRQSRSVGSKDWTKNYRPTYDLKTNEESSDYQSLYEFIEKINDLDDGEFEEYIEGSFDVDGFLRYQAMNLLIGMPDDYWAMGNNYYLYIDSNGYVCFIPYDYDHGFGGGWEPDNWGYTGIATADVLKWRNLNKEFMGRDYAHPLIEKLLKNEKYKKAYLEYLQDFIKEENAIFQYQEYLTNIEQMQKLYSEDIGNDVEEESFSHGRENWYFETKINSVRDQLSQLLGEEYEDK